MSAKQSRTLKIEAVGDFAAGKTRPKIRLTGLWLERAGFVAGHNVEVRLSSFGEIILQFKRVSTFEQNRKLGQKQIV